MITDAYVHVNCDTPGCGSSIEVPLEFVYRTLSEKSGYYDHDDKSVEKTIERDGWIVRDGKHYCGDLCAPSK